MVEPDLTVSEWLRLLERNRDEAAAVLLAETRRAARRRRVQPADRDDLAEEGVARALADGAAALRRANPSTPLGAWLRGCVANVWREMRRARRKEKEKEKEKESSVRPEEIPDPAPPPDDIASERDESRFERKKVLESVHILPRPYGHILTWRLLDGLSWQRIRDRLNAHRPAELAPIKGREARHLITEAVRLLKEHLAGRDPRSTHPHRYLFSKNPWIVATLPPLPSQTPQRARVVRVPEKQRGKSRQTLPLSPFGWQGRGSEGNR